MADEVQVNEISKERGNMKSLKKIMIIFCMLLILAGCKSDTETNAVINTDSSSNKAITSQEITSAKITEAVTISQVETTSTDAETTTATKTSSPTETVSIGTESSIEVVSVVTEPATSGASEQPSSSTAKKVEGTHVFSDEYFNFYLNSSKIHSVHWNGTEEDNDTFQYKGYLYFESTKGIYRVKTDATEFELLVENGTGNLLHSSMTITKVEKGAVCFIRSSRTGRVEMWLRISGDPDWVEPKFFGQADPENKFFFNDKSEVCLWRVVNDNLFSIIPYRNAETAAAEKEAISYNESIFFYKGYNYFTHYTGMYKVTPKGTGFKYILEAEGNVKIDKIENDIIYYHEILNDGSNVINKQLKI
jgi:hypothetical protein